MLLRDHQEGHEGSSSSLYVTPATGLREIFCLDKEVLVSNRPLATSLGEVCSTRGVAGVGETASEGGGTDQDLSLSLLMHLLWEPNYWDNEKEKWSPEAPETQLSPLKCPYKEQMLRKPYREWSMWQNTSVQVWQDYLGVNSVSEELRFPLYILTCPHSAAGTLSKSFCSFSGEFLESH